MPKCPGCGCGWSKDCDNSGVSSFPYCGCGAVHNHDPLVKHRCVKFGEPTNA